MGKTFEAELIQIGRSEFSCVSFKAWSDSHGVLVRIFAAGLTSELQMTNAEAQTIGEQLIAAGKAGEV